MNLGNGEDPLGPEDNVLSGQGDETRVVHSRLDLETRESGLRVAGGHGKGQGASHH